MNVIDTTWGHIGLTVANFATLQIKPMAIYRIIEPFSNYNSKIESKGSFDYYRYGCEIKAIADKRSLRDCVVSIFDCAESADEYDLSDLDRKVKKPTNLTVAKELISKASTKSLNFVIDCVDCIDYKYFVLSVDKMNKYKNGLELLLSLVNTGYSQSKNGKIYKLIKKELADREQREKLNYISSRETNVLENIKKFLNGEKIYCHYWVQHGSKLAEWSEYSHVRTFLNYYDFNYTDGNDSPRGGKEGDYIIFKDNRNLKKFKNVMILINNLLLQKKGI